MSTVDEKAKEVSADAPNEVAESSAPAHDPHEKGDGSGGIIFLFFMIGLVGSLIVGWVIFPKLLYSQKKQPFSFNHKLHVELVNNGCQSCHYFREDGSFSGIPKLASCLECHEEVNGNTQDELVFYEEYIANDREVPWLVYSRQPDCVFFSHAAHVLMGEMECTTCHGHIGESETSRVYEENRITGYSRDIWGKNIAGLKKNSWDRMKMDDCSECHVQEGINQASVQTQKGGCFVCHN